MLMTARLATHEDVPRIVEMGRAFAAQTYYNRVPYCPDSLAQISARMIEQGLLIVGEIDGRVIGAIGALAAPLFVNMSYSIASELFWWVDPEHRNSGIGKLMHDAMLIAAKDRGVKVFSMISIEAVEPEKTKAIYLGLGYDMTEHVFSRYL